MSYAKARKLSFSKQELEELDNFFTTPKSYNYLADMSVAGMGELYRECCEYNKTPIDSDKGVMYFVFAMKNNFEDKNNLPSGDYSLSVSTVLGFRSNPAPEYTDWIDDLLFNFKAWESWGVSRENLLKVVMGFNMLNLENHHTSHLNQLNFSQL